MEFDGEFVVAATPEEAWPYFTDTDILQDCAPGCREIVLTSSSRARAKLEVGVGSVKPSFDIDAVVTEYDEPNRLELEAKGEASRNSFAVTAWQELRANGDGTTTIHWGATAEVSGVIASLGRRAIESVTVTLVHEFFENVQAHIESGTPAEPRLTEAEALEEEFERPPVEGGPLAAFLEAVLGAPDSADREHPPRSEPTARAIRTLTVGAIAGALAVILWNRVRGRGGLGHLLVGIAAGVVGKVLWDAYANEAADRSRKTEPTPAEPGADADADADRPPEAKEPGEHTDQAGATPSADDPEEDDEGMIDDPLDRLT